MFLLQKEKEKDNEIKLKYNTEFIKLYCFWWYNYNLGHEEFEVIWGSISKLTNPTSLDLRLRLCITTSADLINQMMISMYKKKKKMA